jgi:hypothetical protein
MVQERSNRLDWSSNCDPADRKGRLWTDGCHRSGQRSVSRGREEITEVCEWEWSVQPDGMENSIPSLMIVRYLRKRFVRDELGSKRLYSSEVEASQINLSSAIFFLIA